MAIYTRAYSPSSAGQLTSSKGTGGGPLRDADLVEEFRNHAVIWNREPTALVSVSKRIIDTLKRALEKHYRDDESPADIWIAFIEVPDDSNHENPIRIHPARELAEKCGIPDPHLFHHEAVIEWAIPEQCVLHQVSLQTLMDRQLLAEGCLLQNALQSEGFSTGGLRGCIAEALQRGIRDPWGMGVSLASFAKKFGARAPLDWVAHQLFDDCVRNMQRQADVKLVYANRTKFFAEMDDGIDTALIDWWLLDIDFVHAYKVHEDWKSVMENVILDGQVHLWEKWHFDEHDGTASALSWAEELEYDDEYDDLLASHERIRADIEEEAVRIGL